jgi:hypothetical protein
MTWIDKKKVDHRHKFPDSTHQDWGRNSIWQCDDCGAKFIWKGPLWGWHPAKDVTPEMNDTDMIDYVSGFVVEH